MKKKSCMLINPKKYSCYHLKKIHTRNLMMKKIPAARKFSSPRHNLSDGPSLIRCYWTNGPLSLDILLLTWDEPWREHGFEYDSFENQKEPQATKNKTNHLQMSLASKAFTHNLHVRGTKLTASCDLACATQGLDPQLYTRIWLHTMTGLLKTPLVIANPFEGKYKSTHFQ